MYDIYVICSACYVLRCVCDDRRDTHSDYTT